MKNFSELLATEFYIDIELTAEPKTSDAVSVWLNGVCVYSESVTEPVTFRTAVPLLAPLEIQVQGAYVSSLQFDGWESRPEHGQELPSEWQFSTQGLPFYQWQHHATGQGWLLQPQM